MRMLGVLLLLPRRHNNVVKKRCGCAVAHKKR